MKYDMILRMYGGEFLPIVRNDKGVELYRGEYKETAKEALNSCERFIDRAEAGEV